MSVALGDERKRTPSYVFGGLALSILMLIMTALNQAQPPPPPTPEYAPEAVRAITDAPRDQTSQSGRGSQGSEGGAPGGIPSPSAAASIEVQRVKRCIGDPPRQIEDTQSPPCRAYWDGDNGGDTGAPGVTADEIRIAVPARENDEVLNLLFAFFNKRFQFFDRKLVLVGVPNCGGWRPDEMRACAEAAKAQDIFASLSYSDVGGNQQFYYDRLAQLGIISVGSHPDRRSEEHLSKFAPYQWAYLPSFDKIGRHLGSYICRQLNGKPASHGGAEVITQQRKFMLVTNNYSDAPEPDASALKRELAACDIQPLLASVDFEKEGAGWQQANEKTAGQSLNAIVTARDNDVTSIMCVCHSSTTRQLMSTAQGQSYEPEWILSSYAYHDGNAFMSQMPQNQAAHTFGLQFWNKQVDPANETWYHATQYANPSYDYQGNPFIYFGAHYLYHQFLVLASGIQMAGPNLTAQSFQQGMWNTRFPNPPSPYFEGKVGFEDRDHTFVNDAAIIWWDPSGRDPWIGTPGSFCYVRRGERNNIGAYPREDEAFSPRVCRR